MKKFFYVSLMVLLSSTGCSRIDSDAFFDCHIKPVSEPWCENISPELIDEDNPLLFGFAIMDNILIQQIWNDKFGYSISDLKSNDLIGTFCEKGRGPLDALDFMPFSSFVKNDTVRIGRLLSYHSRKYFEWDITESMAEGKTIYSRVVPLKYKAGPSFRPTAFVNIGKDRIVFFALSDAPEFITYDLTSGNPVDTLRFMNNQECPIPLNIYPCSKGDKVFVAMNSLPYYFVMDFATREVKGFRVKSMKPYDPQKTFGYFSSVCCDDEFIYALSPNEYIEQLDSQNTDLMIFSWQGEIVARYSLGGAYYNICSDGDKLYLTFGQNRSLSMLKKADLTR